jgi:GAF domain-containing protein
LPPDYTEFEKRRGPFLPPACALLDRVLKTKRVSYTADMAADATPGSPAKLGGARSAVAVPMLKDETLAGVIFIYRQEVRPFTNKQIQLLTNFAVGARRECRVARTRKPLRPSGGW